MTNLRTLRLDDNQFSGSIPSQLGSLSNLVTLSLFNNRLSGTIPSQLGNLSNLWHLLLNDNQLSGTIPTQLGNLTSLQNIWLNDNRLTGEIPTQLGNLTNLVSINFSCNKLTGSIPTSFGNLTMLEKLLLHGNSISQNVPEALRQIEGLEINVSPHCVEPPPAAPRSASARPKPTPNPVIGTTSASTATVLPGDRLVLQRHDLPDDQTGNQPDTSLDLGIGWVSMDGSRVILVGVIRDTPLGQTYIIVRHEGDNRVVRRWVSPTSPLIHAIDWNVVNTQYTVPTAVLAAVPLDDRLPEHNMLARRFDGGDDRIFAFDAELQQWRHIPDWPTFQALGFYWCNVTAADAGFFERITIGPPYPATTEPERDDYPSCSSG